MIKVTGRLTTITVSADLTVGLAPQWVYQLTFTVPLPPPNQDQDPQTVAQLWLTSSAPLTDYELGQHYALELVPSTTPKVGGPWDVGCENAETMATVQVDSNCGEQPPVIEVSAPAWFYSLDQVGIGSEPSPIWVGNPNINSDNGPDLALSPTGPLDLAPGTIYTLAVTKAP